MKPFWRYYGGKNRAAKKYPVPLLREPIIEPFAGAAGYATVHGAWREVVLVERDPRIAAIWRWLIEATRDDVLALADLPDGATVDDMDWPDAARDLVGFWCNDGSAKPCKSPSKWARGEGTNGIGWSGWCDRSRQRVARQVDMIRSWTVIEGDYSEAPDIRATWFIDPPYQTAAGRHYTYSEIDYDRLGRWCDGLQGLVIACDQEGADWREWNRRISVKALPTAARNNTSKEVAWVRGEVDVFSLFS